MLSVDKHKTSQFVFQASWYIPRQTSNPLLFLAFMIFYSKWRDTCMDKGENV